MHLGIVTVDKHTTEQIRSSSDQLLGRIATIHRQRLTSNPRSIGAEEFDNRRNIFDLSKAFVHSLGLVEFNGFGSLLGIEQC